MSVEIESSLKQALRHLHSTAPTSTEQVRLLLDEHLRAAAGPARTLGVLLPDKYLDDEKYARRVHSQAQGHYRHAQRTHRDEDDRDDDDADADADGERRGAELSLELLQEDLACAVCRQMSVQAGNRLVECEGCRALYHQDCHSPAITDEQMNSEWHCFACRVTGHPAPPPTKPSRPTPPSSGPPSAESATGRPMVSGPPAKVPIPMNPSSTKTIAPNVNIISADRRLQIMKKKAARQQENKRKHSK